MTGIFRGLPSLLVLMLAASPTLVHSQTKAERIQEVARAYHEVGVFNGCLLVIENGDRLVSASHGLANRVWDIPNTPDTRFLIGSVTKVFTGILTLQLAEAGRLSLDAVVTEYLPEYRPDTGDRITVHQLVTHTSGLPDYFDREFFENHKDRKYSKSVFLKRFLSPDLVAEPGSSTRYSSVNYYLLGLMIERVTGQAFDQVLRERILDPLEMADSGFNRFDVVEPQLASGYIRNYLGYWSPPFEVSESSAFSAGAMFATVEDLARFEQALRENRLLPNESLNRLLPGSLQIPWRAGGRPLPGSVNSESPTPNHRLVQQMAGNTTTGFTAILTRVPEDGHFVAVLTNAGPGYFNDPLHDLNRAILGILYDQPVEIPTPNREAGLGQSILSEGIEPALKAFIRSLGKEIPDERRMNRLGYQLLALDRIEDAVIIFQMNVDHHPESANAYDSLAEACLRAGERERAKENYRKALDLDGDGPIGRKAEIQLRRLGT